MYIVAIIVLVLDQVVKYLVRTNMNTHQSIPVIRNIFLTKYSNQLLSIKAIRLMLLLGIEVVAWVVLLINMKNIRK